LEEADWLGRRSCPADDQDIIKVAPYDQKFHPDNIPRVNLLIFLLFLPSQLSLSGARIFALQFPPLSLGQLEDEHYPRKQQFPLSPKKQNIS
jgi:hypothetical protein